MFDRLLTRASIQARADEAARLVIADITWGSSPSVRLLGKGNKMRVCPIWKRTADELRLLAGARTPVNSFSSTGAMNA
jgi:integrase